MAHDDAPATDDPSAADEVAIEVAIIELLRAREPGATICPSEAARAVAGEADPSVPAGEEPWRALMDPAREAARRLVNAGEIDVVQQGAAVDPSTATGPIRLRLRIPS